MTGGASRTQEAIVAAAVIRKGEKILICRRPEGNKLAGYWEFPGGKVEDGENPGEALVRELKEEIGIRASIGSEILTVSHLYDYGKVKLHFFNAEISCGTPSPLHHAEIRWVNISSLPAYTFPPANDGLISLLLNGV